MSIAKLKLLAEGVEDSYEDFVDGLLAFANKHGFVDEMIEYIEKYPNARTDDVLKHLEMLEGYPEPLDIIDD